MTVSRSDKIRGFRDGARAGVDAHARVLDGGPANEYGDAVIVDVGRALGVALAADPARPTGIVAVNDLFALGLMAGLRDGGSARAGRRVGRRMDGHFLSAISIRR